MRKVLISKALAVVLILVASLLPTAAAWQAAGQLEGEKRKIERMEREHEAAVSPSRSAADLGRLTSQVRGAQGSSPGRVVPRRNFIDEHLFGRMKRDGIPHAGLASDEIFLRRVTLDLTGRIPDARIIREFVRDRDPNKRDQLIDSLLGSQAYVDRWAYWFGDFFRIHRGTLGEGADLFYMWVKEQLRVNRPYDVMVREMLTASGKNNALVAQASLVARDWVKTQDIFVNQEDSADELTISLLRNFLGVNVSCISCHDGKGHAEKVNLWLSTRTRKQFWDQSAFFGKTRLILMRRPDGMPKEEFTVNDLGRGYDTGTPSVLRPPRGSSVEASFLLDDSKPAPGKNLREELARLLTSNPQFARATVNIFWAQFMSVGFVDPVDSFDLVRLDPRNPPPTPWKVQPNNPELLEALAEDFRVHEYDLKRLFKLITQSSAYQLASDFPGEWKDSYAPYYARKFVRLLGAEELHDAIIQATGVLASYTVAGRSEKAGFAMNVLAPDDINAKEIRYWLTAFGQSNRQEFKKPVTLSMLQPILLMNHDLINKRLTDSASLLSRLLSVAPALSDDKIIAELYLSTLSRLPLPAETAVLSPRFKENRRQAAEDLQWALLNKLDFVFNY